MRLLKLHRVKIRSCFIVIMLGMLILIGRLSYLSMFDSKELSIAAKALHERERAIKASRGRIITCDGTVIADNKAVCTVSVIHSQITDKEKVIEVLSTELSMDEAKVRKYVEKVSSMETVKTNVPKEIGDAIRKYDLDGVKVDEDSKRVYPYHNLASKVIGFTGGDNQGIVGLEVEYEDVLKGINGQILTMTDAAGKELSEPEIRVEPIAGNDLYLTLDYNIQSFCMQAAMKAYEAKSAKSVSIIVMNPQDGSIYAMVNYPEYNLNEPFVLDVDTTGMTDEKRMDLLNKKWRNGIINDTYEPGSTFKIITTAAGLSTGAISPSDSYYCRGSITVGGRNIRCHKTTGHGSQSLAETLHNSCNPAFITWGSRIGVENFLSSMRILGLMSTTGVDLPGEAGTIMHAEENIHELELATISFGQSFQITPLQLLRAVSCVINGGTLITPHFGDYYIDNDGIVQKFTYDTKEEVLTPEVCNTIKEFLEGVVEYGGGSGCKIEGYSIGGKTATSEKLPRGNGKYIASFIGFAPVDDPQVIAMCIVDEPVGMYYGGLVATPVVKEIFENIFPYLGIEQENTAMR